jgi:hypothetical protein
MALITIPASPEKGVAQEYSLDFDELSLLVSDSYFKTQSNLSKIVLMYKSATSNQIEAINFIPNGSSSFTSEGEFSPEALDEFVVDSITLIDKQNGRYIVYGSDIPNVANYSLLFVAPVIPFFLRDYSDPSTPEAFESFLGSSVTGGKLLFNAINGAEYTANPVGIEFTQGREYKFRLYVAADSEAPASVSFQLGESAAEAHNFTQAQIIAARGSFVEYSFTATASQETTNPFVKLIKNGVDFTLTIDKIEIIELPAPALGFSETLKASEISVDNNGLSLFTSNAPVVSWGYLDQYLSTTSGKFAVAIEFGALVTTQSYLFFSNLNSDPTIFFNNSGPGANTLGLYLSGTENPSSAYVRENLGYGVVFGPNSNLLISPGQTYTMAFDFDLKRLFIAKNGVWISGLNPSISGNGIDITNYTTAARIYIAIAINIDFATIVAVPNLPAGFTDMSGI